MKVNLVQPYGYCNGVKRAIDLALKTKLDNPTIPVYVLGNLVHNAHVASELAQSGIITIHRETDLSKLDKGFIITTAHGTSNDIHAKIKENGFRHIDATCPLVYRSFSTIKRAIDNNLYVLYFGSKNHPEAVAAYSINPAKITVFEQLEDLRNLPHDQVYILTNQTTIRSDALLKFYDYLVKEHYNVKLMDEICHATKTRQNSLKDALNSNYDVVFIVGDTTSNNSTQLYNLAKEKIANTFFIDSVNSISLSSVKNASNVLVCSGASTPDYLVDEVITFLENYTKKEG